MSFTISALAIAGSLSYLNMYDRYDHQLHGIAGAATYTAARIVGGSPEDALAACVAVAVAKQFLDKFAKMGTAEFSDIVATVLPCAGAWVVETILGNSSNRSVASYVSPYRTYPGWQRDMSTYYYSSVRPTSFTMTFGSRFQ